jgi:hypothetical protein
MQKNIIRKYGITLQTITIKEYYIDSIVTTYTSITKNTIGNTYTIK